MHEMLNATFERLTPSNDLGYWVCENRDNAHVGVIPEKFTFLKACKARKPSCRWTFEAFFHNLCNLKSMGKSTEHSYNLLVKLLMRYLPIGLTCQKITMKLRI